MTDPTRPEGWQTQHQQTPWWGTLGPAEAEIACGDGRHVIRWENGGLTLLAHADTEAELVLAALGAGKPRCVELAEMWARHHDDLDVLAIGPRGNGDEVPVTWYDVDVAGSGKAGPPIRPQSTPMRRALVAFASAPQPGGGRGLREAILQSRARQVELLSLLALGPAFQMRLSASVAAAWPGKAETGKAAALAAALTGRLGPVVESWLGIDAALVTARPHDGPGWGELELTSPQARTWRRAGHGLRASLPVDWLARIWAPGLALVGRHLVVAVHEANWPDARVLALAAPGAGPVTLGVRATASQCSASQGSASQGSASGGRGNAGDGAHWVITDTGEGPAKGAQ